MGFHQALEEVCMALERNTRSYRSIFSPSTRQEQDQNFDLYWQFCQAYSGELLEAEQDLTRKRDILRAFQAHPVRARHPLPAPDGASSIATMSGARPTSPPSTARPYSWWPSIRSRVTSGSGSLAPGTPRLPSVRHTMSSQRSAAITSPRSLATSVYFTRCF